MLAASVANEDMVVEECEHKWVTELRRVACDYESAMMGAAHAAAEDHVLVEALNIFIDELGEQLTAVKH